MDVRPLSPFRRMTTFDAHASLNPMAYFPGARLLRHGDRSVSCLCQWHVFADLHAVVCVLPEASRSPRRGVTA